MNGYKQLNETIIPNEINSNPAASPISSLAAANFDWRAQNKVSPVKNQGNFEILNNLLQSLHTDRNIYKPTLGHWENRTVWIVLGIFSCKFQC